MADYWVIVALDYQGDMAWLMAEGPDCRSHDVIDGSAVEDFADMNWAKGQPAGLYRLTLGVGGDGDEIEVWVDHAEMLMAFPPMASVARKPGSSADPGA